MGKYQRPTIDPIWMPSVDKFKCPPNGFLRMDNLVADELGAVALRQGSAKVNASAFADTDVHSLFTATLSGTRHRMSGCTDAVYDNGTSISTSVNGSGDISFGAHMGQILFARGTTKKKYDGTTVRNLGIAAPGAAPTLSGLTADQKTFANCNHDDSPYFLPNEVGTPAITAASNATPIVITTASAHGLVTGQKVLIDGVLGNTAANGAFTITVASPTTFSLGGSVGNGGYTSGGLYYVFATDRGGNSQASIEIVPDSSTGRGTATKTFGSPTDFTSYTGGQVASDDDLIDFYVYVTEPQYLANITLMIDVNDGAFEQDWYDYTLIPGDVNAVARDSSEVLESNYTVEGYDRELLRSKLDDLFSAPSSSLRTDKPVSSSGWNHISFARGKMIRHGSTAGKNWSTVKAIRVTFTGSTGGSSAALRFDDIQVIGGAARPLTGKFKAAIVAVRNDGTYQAKSAPSTFSAEIEVKAQAIRATLDSSTVNALDSQVNELWLYLFGGGTDGFYRFATKTGGPFSGAQTIDATASITTALAANLRMETDNTTPPSSIIGIEGPHYDRTLYLTATTLQPSRQLNPDSCSTGEGITVGDATETALWVKKVGEGGLYVGTTRDIYRLDGDFTPLPDGSINVVKRPLGISAPPISSAVAVGEINGVQTLVYLSGDGWRLVNGQSLVTGEISLLWHGYARHDVFYVNVGDSASRFRIAITKNQLTAITPEFPSTTSSVVLHRYDFTKQRWYRFTYTPSFRSIYAEKDGTLIAGDSSGFVRTLDYAINTDDDAAIPVVLWTGSDDNGEPFSYKDGENLSIRMWSAEDDVRVDVCLNGSSSANQSYITAQTEVSPDVISLTDLGQFAQHQLRISGNVTSFVYRGYELNYLDGPAPYVLHDTGFIDLGLFSWVRKIRVKARYGSNFTVTPYFDGAAYTPTTVQARDGIAYVYDVPLGREAKGRGVRGVVTSDDPGQVFWMEFEYNDSGRTRQKRIERFAGIK